MRRLFAALMAVVVALAIVGCGGGEEAPQQTAGDTPPPPPAGTPAAEEAQPDRSPTETVDFSAFPTGKQMETITPTAILDNLEEGQAMMIFFYDRTQPEWDEVNEQVRAVAEDYRGLIEVIAFDMRNSQPTLPNVDPELAKAATLADRLGIRSTPYLMIVDSQGLITWRWRGYVDASILEREVMRATQ